MSSGSAVFPSVTPEQEDEWRFLFVRLAQMQSQCRAPTLCNPQDLHGVLQIPDALDKQHVDDLNALLDTHIETDTDNNWQTLRFPVSSDRPSAQTEVFESLLDWGKPMRDCLAVPGIVEMCDAIIGKRYRLDHIYLDVIRPPKKETVDAAGGHQQPGPIANGLHGSSGGFDPAQYYHYENGQMFNGLSVVAFNLNPADPETDGGFACVPGTHKSNYRFPNGWRNMQEGVHPIVQRIGGDAGSCIIFTEALTHGTLPWTGKGERRTLFMKLSPHPLSWAAGYFDVVGKSWESELTDKQRLILEPPSVPGTAAAAGARQRWAEASAAKAQANAKL